MNRFRSISLYVLLILAATVTAATAQTLLDDTFESYPAGVYPSGGWLPFANAVNDAANNIVTDQQHYDGSQSLQTTGAPSGYWSGGFYQIVTFPTVLYIDVAFMNSGQVFGNNGHAYESLVDLIWLPVGSGCSYLIYSHKDGNIYGIAGGPLLSNWQPMRWYQARLKVDFPAGTVDYWIDGVYKGQQFYQGLINTQYRGVELNCGSGKAWFDGVRLYTDALVAVTGGPFWTGPGYIVTLDGSGSYHSEYPARDIAAWDWDLDNDGAFETAGMIATSSWPQTGDYTVGLRVTDNTGVTATATTVVHVVGDPVAAITAPSADNTSFYGDAIGFAGTETFSGSPAGRIASRQWTSDLDGFLSDLRAFSTNRLSIGTHTITYRVTDNVGRFSTATTTVTVRPLSERIDLALEWGDITFWKSGQQITNPAPGDAVEIRARIHNLSDGASSPAALAFSDIFNGSLTSLVAVDNVPAIPGWGTQTVTYAWTVPADNGYHVIQVDIGQDPSETYIENNHATHFIVVGAQQPAGNMNIELSGLQPYANYQVQKGSAFVVSGTAAYRWANGQTLPLMGGLVSIKVLGGEEWQTRTLSAGTPGYFNQTTYAPMTPGSYVVRITVTDSTLSTYTDIPFSVTTPPGPNLAVGSIWLEKQVATMPDTVHAYIVNRGGLDAVGDITNHLKVFAPTGELVFEGDATILGGLAAGSGAYVSFSGFVPAVSGSYQLAATADSTYAIDEGANEGDNSLTASSYVYPNMVDLSVVDLRKECFKLYALVRNVGGLTSAGATVQFRDETGTVFGTGTVAPLPGKDSAVWVESPALYAQTGSHTITARVAGVEDPNPVNDERSAAYVFENVTDFAVSDVWVNGLRWSNNVVYQDLGATIEAEVYNAGCRAGSGTLSFQVDGAAVGAVVDVTLSGTQAQSFSIPYTFASAIYPNGTTYQLQGRVVSADDAYSSNNARIESLTVSPQLPDYQVLSEDITFSFDPSRHPARNEKFNITAKVCNVGRAAAIRFQVAFYEEGREQIGVVQMVEPNPPLAVGSCYTAVPRDSTGAEVTWGSGFSGNHTILVSAAPVAGDQDDPNDANNQATRKVWVNHPPNAQVALASKRTVSKPKDTCTFSAAGSSDNLDLDGKGWIDHYEWTFGDGQTATTAAASVDHTYAATGTFNVTVKAVDNNNEASDPAAIDVIQTWEYTITPSAGVNGSISPSGPVTANYGDNVTFTITPAANCHVDFVLIDNVSVGAVNSYTFTNVTANHTIIALFAVDTRTFTVWQNTGGSVSPSGTFNVPYGSSQTFTITPNTGYHIVNFFSDNIPLGPVTSYNFENVTTNHTVWATFAVDTRTITASAGANGSISPSGAVTVNYGASQTFTITPSTNYHVANVLVDGSSVGAPTSYRFDNVVANHTISATFAVDTRTFTVWQNTGGSVSPSGTFTVPYGSSQTFTITPNTGYRVVNFFADNVPLGPVTSYNFENVTTSHTVWATFAVDTRTITASAGANGSISPSGAVTVNYGASQTFTITPDAGYQVDDVLVDGNSVGAQTIFNFPNVTANHTISASFSIRTYMAVTVLSPNGGEIIPSGGNYTIQWGAPSAAVKFNLSYTLNGSNYTTIANGATGTSYNWVVPKPSANSPLCKVKVIGLNSSNKSVGTDTSDGNFMIEVVRLTSPDGGGGQTLQIGTVVPITWSTNGTSKTVNKVILSYSTNGGGTWTTITTINNTNPGTYDWTVANAASNTCKVKVDLYNNNTAVGSDASDNNFTIAP